MNVQHELRAALIADGTLWGYLSLLRQPDAPDFSASETAFVSAVATHLAQALRAIQLSAALGLDGAPSTPGLILLGSNDEVQAATPQADELLEEMGHGWRQGERLPEVAYVLAAAARAIARGAVEPGVLPRGRLRAPSGRWLVLHGSVLTSAAGTGQVAITVEPATTSDVAPLLVKAYDFTQREQEVVLLVLRGLSTSEIAHTLCIAPYTVQDHLKAIFDKAGVRSRRELVTQVFYRHHAA
jgi:DNA-binding CsgD family transcriptional regulator